MLMFFEKHLPWVNKITKAVMDPVTVAAILNIKLQSIKAESLNSAISIVNWVVGFHMNPDGV